MSYILEALKKSEQERGQGSVPDIKSVHKPEIPGVADSRQRWWLWVLLVVILINGGVFAVVYFGEGDTSDITASAQQPSLADKRQVETVAEPLTSAETIQPATTSTPSTQSQQPPKRQETVEQAPRSRVVFSSEPLQLDATLGNAVPDKKDTGTSQTASTVKEPTAESGPAGLVSELPESVRKQIPSIEFGGHVYSSKVKRRSVMINGKRMREGEAVGSGLLLTKITPQGAEFEFQGYRFRLNALQDWSYR